MFTDIPKGINHFIRLTLGTKPILLAGILIIAFTLRIIGYKWGAGQLLHVDEVAITEPAYWMDFLHTYDPGNYYRPAHWSIYIHNFTYKIVSKIFFDKPLADIYPSCRPFFTYVSRILSSIWGTLLVLVIFHIGQLTKKGAGWIAALYASIFTPYIIHSHYVTPDISIAMLVALSMLFAIKYFQTNKIFYFILWMIALACCIGEKYPGLLIAFISGVHIFVVKTNNPLPILNNRWKRSALFLMGIILFLFVVSPYLFIHFDQVIKCLTFESRSEQLGADGLGWTGNFLFYLNCIKESTGVVFLGFISISLFSVFRLTKNNFWTLLYPLFFLLVLSKVALHWERWIVPVYISPIILGACGILFVYQKAKSIFLKSMIGIIILIPFLFSTIKSIEQITYFLSKKNTLSLCNQFCILEGITQANSIRESITPLGKSGIFYTDLVRFSKDSAFHNTKHFAIVSFSIYHLLEKHRNSQDPELLKYKELIYQKAIKEFKFQIPDYGQFNNPYLADLNDIYNQFIFLINVWWYNKNFITGDEIRIYKIGN